MCVCVASERLVDGLTALNYYSRLACVCVCVCTAAGERLTEPCERLATDRRLANGCERARAIVVKAVVNGWRATAADERLTSWQVKG